MVNLLSLKKQFKLSFFWLSLGFAIVLFTFGIAVSVTSFMDFHFHKENIFWSQVSLYTAWAALAALFISQIYSARKALQLQGRQAWKYGLFIGLVIPFFLTLLGLLSPKAWEPSNSQAVLMPLLKLILAFFVFFGIPQIITGIFISLFSRK